MFVAAAPDRPITYIEYYLDTDGAVDGCSLTQNGDDGTSLETRLTLDPGVSYSRNAITSHRGSTKSQPGGDDEKRSLSRDELDPAAIATLLQNTVPSDLGHVFLKIYWDDEFKQFAVHVRDAVYALDGTLLG